MSEGLLEAIDMSGRSRIGGMSCVIVAFFIALNSVGAGVAQAQVGGRGPDPIPAFVQDVGGGGGDTLGPTVNFDPSNSYLPSPPVGQSYQYTLTWDFGDGSAKTIVGPNTSTIALGTVAHTFPAPPVGAAYDPNTTAGGLYVVTLQIDVTVINQNNVASPGPSAQSTGKVRSASVNYPPVWSLVNNSSPSVGVLPYQLNVDCAASYDPDGYVIWAAIDWGDGSADLLPKLPPSNTAITSLHSYTTAGSYTVTLSLIDNGRIPPGTPLDPTPSPNNPGAALKTIQTLQHTLIDNGTLTGPIDPATGLTVFNADKYLPILRQTTIQVAIVGNLQVIKGQFSVDFSSTGHDSFDSTFLLNLPLASISNAQVSVFLGSGANSLVLRQFTTDAKGNFFNAAQGLKFTITPKRSLIRFQIGQASLQQAFQLSNGTVKNGTADIPIQIVISGSGGTSVLSTKLRFIYNAKSGVSGVGKKPHSVNVSGN